LVGSKSRIDEAQMGSRRRKLKRDDRGGFRPYIGYKLVNPDAEPHLWQRRQHRFNLGSDQRLAEVRYARIQKLYEENCQACGESTWSPAALSFAEQIASGKGTVEYSPGEYHRTIDYAQYGEVFKKLFPSLAENLVPSEPAIYAESVDRTRAMIEKRTKKLFDELDEIGALAAAKVSPHKLIAGSFHEALDAYRSMIERDGERLEDGTLKLAQRKRLETAARLKEHHADFPLYELTFDKCKQLVDYWRNRPLTKRKSRFKKHSARHHVAELFAFFKWLDVSDLFQWEMPRGVLTLKRNVVRLEADQKKSVVSKPVYSPAELAIIATHATQWERLALLVGLNCAMGAAELGRLTTDCILLGHEHEHAERLEFQSTVADSFERTLRPKTNVFSEHWLWPETADMLRWARKRSESLGTDLVFVRTSGQRMYDESSNNPQSPFANLWKRLLNRVKKHEGEKFRWLPFGTLRDTLPDMLRHRYGDELASLCLAHGTPSGADSLLDCYGNRPYGRLHAAIRSLHATFKGVLIAGTGSSPSEPTKT
jgi:hypothetical protein